MYEEVVYVLEGRGATEIWTPSKARKQIFEWQPGSVFSPPLNAYHRILNGSSAPALLLSANSGPPIMELFRSARFVFDCDFEFGDRYSADGRYFDPTVLTAEQVSGRAIYEGALLPDAVHCELPLDGQRGEGHRHFFVRLSGNFFSGFVASYPAGRYSKTHAHESGPILLCLAGRGYTLTWPRAAGTTPWKDGNGSAVIRQDYGPGGVVSAAPGGSDWFHAHFGTARDGLRVLAFLGAYPPRVFGAPGDDVAGMNMDIRKGGGTIEYRDEDPAIRDIFRRELDLSGASFDMPSRLFGD
jgi:quercetin dioxygenase-like cupin family protein